VGIYRFYLINPWQDLHHIQIGVKYLNNNIIAPTTATNYRNGNYPTSVACTNHAINTFCDRSITFNDTKQEAHGQWLFILTAHGLPAESLCNRHQACPLCGGKDRFRYDDKAGNGTYYCNQCGAGDGFTLLAKYNNWTAKEALDAVIAYLGINPTNTPTTPQTPRITQTPSSAALSQDNVKIKALERLRDESRPIQADDPAAKYLRNRGLELSTYPKALRHISELPYYEDGKLTASYPAMLARVDTPDGKPLTWHRTYLTPDGHKAAVTAPRKLMAPGIASSTLGAAIRLYAPTDTLCVCEGIETALAVHVATGFPVWATISANGMAALILPDTVKRVWIMADNDASGTGEKAASILASRLRLKGCDCRVLLPKGPIPEHSKGIDFLDELGGAA
jgi:putative DNA primase/helicase